MSLVPIASWGKHTRVLLPELANECKSFFKREDVSRMTSGKKQTLTRAKNKQQKRFLNDTVSNLHSKFLAENSDLKISYRTFCRLKPFWVVWPKEKDRDTCQCKTHENLHFFWRKNWNKSMSSALIIWRNLLLAFPAQLPIKLACTMSVSCKNKQFPFELHDCAEHVDIVEDSYRGKKY